MKSLALASVFLLVGCSHVVTDKKVARELPFAPELVEEMQKVASRQPASLEVSEMEGKSPRRVYFTALYHQYLTLTNHLGEKSDVNSCPQFHHDKIETDDSAVPTVTFYKSKSVRKSNKEFFPETIFNKNFPLRGHQESIREEIAVLCEEGVSDNYYKFDNLVTHYANKRSFHERPDAMRAVLKIPVFANYYLLKMLQAPQAASFIHPEEKKVIDMTHTHWFERYVSEAHRMRGDLIKNSMVQR